MLDFKYRNRLIVILHDMALIPLAWFGAYGLRFEAIPHWAVSQAIALIPLILCAQAMGYFFANTYRSVWGFASVPDLVKLLKSVLIGSSLFLGFSYIGQHIDGLPRSIVPLYMMILTMLLTGSRLSLRVIKDLKRMRHDPDKKRVLIVGAGDACEGLVRDMQRSHPQIYQPVALVDDNNSKQGKEIHGVRIVGRTRDIPKVIHKYDVQSIVLAMPSVPSEKIRRIMRICEKTALPVHTLPSLNHIVSGKVSIDLLREISLEDLLGRDPVKLDWGAIEEAIQDKIILVSGAGGSIGSEVCRQVCKLKPKLLIAVDNCEFNLFNLEQELYDTYPNLTLFKYLNSVTDNVGISDILSRHHPHIIFHAAAFKHVPLLQNQVREAVMNNVLGTQCLAEAAIKAKVEKFVMVSTDKAVNPENIMGATKRASEIICQSLNDQAQTQFITVRFGNVLGSAGSVVPIFKKQIEKGGPVTVTHPDITRYFMTIPEASQLILQAMTLGAGGEIFVLDMGDPVKIKYLAEQMILLTGKKPGVDIKIEYTQLRPGEKLFEELFHEKEALQPTLHSKILKAAARQVQWAELANQLSRFLQACDQHNIDEITALLKALVPEMTTNQVSAEAEVEDKEIQQNLEPA